MIADTRTWQAAGEAARDALSRAGWSCEPWILPDRPGGKSPVCDDATHAVMSEGVPMADAYVAVGSGVVNDSTKWLAAERGAPYAVLATAASMNGYASANVAPAIRGVKSLAHGRAPRVVAALPSVIEAAPFRLTAAGLGDVIAKPISTADWIVNHRVFSEPFSAEIASIIDSLEPAYLDRPEALAAREPGAIRALFDALVRSGCAMTLHGSSLPASGGEHLVSHTLDMLADLDGVEHDLHGRQVGVATILAAALYEKLVAMERPVFEPRVAPFDLRDHVHADGVGIHRRRSRRGAREEAGERRNRLLLAQCPRQLGVVGRSTAPLAPPRSRHPRLPRTLRRRVPNRRPRLLPREIPARRASLRRDPRPIHLHRPRLVRRLAPGVRGFDRPRAARLSVPWTPCGGLALPSPTTVTAHGPALRDGIRS